MHITTENLTGKHTAKLAVYDSVNDFALRLLNCDSNAQAYLSRLPTGWAGGDENTCLRGCRGQDHSYADEADKYVTQFGNVAIQQNAIDLEFNMEQGELDVGAWQSGEPECLYGPTVTKTDRAPIAVTLDQWIWSGCRTSVIKRRGVAAMALVQALSMYRPVMLYAVIAHRHMPSRTNAVQIVPAPSNPMDTGRCAFMLAAPPFVRAGMMPMLHQIAGSPAQCGIPETTAGMKWQTNEFGAWLSTYLGVEEDNVVHLPMMLDNQSFGSDNDALAWVQDKLEKYT